MRTPRGARVLLISAAALQAVAHATGAAPLVASGHLAGSILALFCLVGVGASLRFLVADCIEARAIVLTIGLLSLVGFGLSVSVGYPGEPTAALTPASLVAALSSVIACVSMLTPRAPGSSEIARSAAYYR